MKLNKEEQNLLRSIEHGEWKAVTNRAELRKYQEAAKQMMKKDARLNIRISSYDLHGLQKRATLEGLPYQTFVSSLLHKYVSGRLVEV